MTVLIDLLAKNIPNTYLYIALSTQVFGTTKWSADAVVNCQKVEPGFKSGPKQKVSLLWIYQYSTKYGFSTKLLLSSSYAVVLLSWLSTLLVS